MEKSTLDLGLDFLSPGNALRLDPRISTLIISKYVGDMAVNLTGDMDEMASNMAQFRARHRKESDVNAIMRR
jgi:hypothetical protein